ncbi:hypothetical protein LILAB_18540 [Corallococcus macrosporus]|uniref:Uncharacterized protein n=1 Tax=Myxococcus fulvus (strain ATCC BAA-855 / HW-1) TaxID=483219 RepID=F8C6M1_MYXFH|nr:hypothetical protein LILAB_18540 [Corallococcus macrosporus]
MLLQQSTALGDVNAIRKVGGLVIFADRELIVDLSLLFVSPSFVDWLQPKLLGDIICEVADFSRVFDPPAQKIWASPII